MLYVWHLNVLYPESINSPWQHLLSLLGLSVLCNKNFSAKDWTLHNSMSLYAPGSVMTPYYSEETVYSKSDLDLENEDGVSIIFYLQKIYPGSISLWFPFNLDSWGFNYLLLCYQFPPIFILIPDVDEWNNFMERINCKRESEVWGNEENVLQLRHWASLRGQTLCRTGNLIIICLILSNKDDFANYQIYVFLLICE